MGSAAAQRGVWTEERIARELEAWFAERSFEQWPPYRAFVRDGRKRLHAGVMRFGGRERWALELGVPVVEDGRGRRFSDEEILEALRVVLRAHRPQRFPSRRWLVEHAPPGIASAVESSGGASRWAAALGVPPRQPARWTDERLERELRRVCAGRVTWPTRAEFEAAGATGLLRAVYQGRGSRWWAERLGLEATGLRQRRSSR